MPANFDYHMFHRRRKWLKFLGLLFVLTGVFMILDMVSEIPMPLTGYRAIFGETVLILFGITESELVRDARVDRPTAGRIVSALIAKGFLRRASIEGGTTEEVFEPVR
ncbi:MAG TPA: hypothetical protein VL171_05955 [Verrucomicrobiae bacterium]|nr:hypothetical protein [Verrucomicrobiae bacterium]